MPGAEQRAAQKIQVSLEEAIHSASGAALMALVADPGFSEDLALALLKRADVPPDILEKLSKNEAAKARKVKLGIVGHARTPRHVSIVLLRQLFTFDLMRVALTPTVAGDIKIAAEEILIKKMESLSSGERLSLARRASGRVAGALLLDSETGVLRAVLENPRLTEAVVIRALMAGGTAGFVRMVCEHPKWSLRREVRVALLRNERTPIDCAMEFARTIAPAQVREILRSSRLPTMVKASILVELAKRG